MIIHTNKGYIRSHSPLESEQFTEDPAQAERVTEIYAQWMIRRYRGIDAVALPDPDVTGWEDVIL